MTTTTTTTTTKKKIVNAWYFSNESRFLFTGDRRPIVRGKDHTTRAVRKSPLHGSVRALDALGNAEGAMVWRVELSGRIHDQGDRVVATRRRYVAGGVVATATLRAFARACALDVAHLWKNMPPFVRQYLETGDESLRELTYCAGADRCRHRDVRSMSLEELATLTAARAARDAAWQERTVWDAPWPAWPAVSASWAAEAAREAMRWAQGAEAEAALREKQNARLEEMLERLTRGENDARN